jgi:hypothetical protein
MDKAMSKNGWAPRAIGPIVALALLGGAGLLGTGLVGCVGHDPQLGEPATSTLVLAEAAPLETLAEEAWAQAPDCEGLVTSTVSFRVASLSGGLVAVVGSSGEVICVDSVEAISSDLDECGREAEAAALAASFFAAVHAEDMAVAISGMTSDPEPQPNSRPRGIGDPEPQPN